jgi:hypothetical protein
MKTTSDSFYDAVSNSDCKPNSTIIDILEKIYKQELVGKINEFETNCKNTKNKNIRDLCSGINEFKKGYHLRTTKLL